MTIAQPNLVQIQSRLKGLPNSPQTMQYLKAAKDGHVLTVPPYIAAAELSTREAEQKREMLARGAAQGKVPSVSEQLSQKADLMSMMAMKEKAAAQQSAEQSRQMPMPAPEGTPEPQEQPQPEQGAGVDQIPVQFGLAGGGIIAFEEGGDTDKKKKKKTPSLYDLSRDPLLEAYYRQQAGELDTSALPQGALEGAGGDYSSPEAQIAKQRLGTALATPGAAMLDVAGLPINAIRNLTTHGGVSMTPFYDDVRKREQQAGVAQAQAAMQSQAAPQVPPVSPEAKALLTSQRPGYTPPQQPPGMQAPAAAQPPKPPAPAAPAAAPGAQPAEGGLPDIQAMLAQKPQAPSLEQSIADTQKAQAAFGLNAPAGAEERDLIKQMRERHAQEQAARDRLGLKAVLAGFGRGFGGAAAADIESAQRAYAQDMAHQKSMYDMINAINKGNRGEAEKAFEKTMGMQESREKEAGAGDRNRLSAATNVYAAQLQAGSSKYNADLHYKAAMAQANLADKRGDRADKAAALTALRGVQTGLVQEIGKLTGSFKKEDRELRARYEQQLEDVRQEIVRMSGGDVPSLAKGAAAPAPANRPPLASFQK